MKKQQVGNRSRRKQASQRPLSRLYSEVFSFIRTSAPFIWTSVLLFLFAALLGLAFPAPEPVASQILSFIEELLLETEGLTQGEMIWFLFQNNILSAFMGMMFGILIGIFPLISSLVNGYLVGFVSRFAVQEYGPLVMWRLLPHGIFELPALFLSLGIGLRLGTYLFEEKPAHSFLARIRLALLTFFLVIFPLLVIAAIIEGSLIVLFP